MHYFGKSSALPYLVLPRDGNGKGINLSLASLANGNQIKGSKKVGARASFSRLGANGNRLGSCDYENKMSHMYIKDKEGYAASELAFFPCTALSRYKSFAADFWIISPS